MALGIYSGVALLTNGGVSVGDAATIEVRKESDGLLASIFEDRAGAVGLSNPFVADSLGRFQFYAAGIDEGYRIKVTKGGENYTLNNQPVGTLQERDTADAQKLEDCYLNVHLGGAAIDEEIIFDGFFFDETVTITEVTLYARDAPVGAALTIDFTKDGVEEANIATLADGVKKQATVISGLSYTVAEEFGLKVKSVGSTGPGVEITIIIHYQINALS